MGLKFWRSAVALLMAIMLLGGLSGAAMAKQDVTVELFYSGVWNDHTADVYTRDSISISHAGRPESTGPAPSEASLTFQGRDGRMNPANIRSPLYGLIGQGTQIRINIADDIRFSGRIVSAKPRRAVKGDAWIEIKAGGWLRQLGQGTPPVQSALHRTMLAKSPSEQWTLEDGTNATQFASAVGGLAGIAGRDSSIIDEPARPGGHSGIPGSARSVLLPLGAFVRMPVRPYSDTGQWVIQVAAISDDLEWGEPSLVAKLSDSSEIVISVSDDFDPGVQQSLIVEVFDSAGTPVFLDNVLLSTNLVDVPMSLMVALTSASGGDLVARVLDGNGTIQAESATTGAGYGTPGEIRATTAGGLTTQALVGASHVGLYTSLTFDPDVDTVTIARAISGWDREKAGDRFGRLCAELGITATIVGNADDTQLMGPQPPETTLGLLREIATTDNGFIFDTRTQLGLTLRTGRSLRNQ